MVQLSKRGQALVYELRDGDRAIGQVVAPAGRPALGVGAGTVLLRREPRAYAGTR